MDVLFALFGILVLLLIARLLGERGAGFPIRVIVLGVALQYALALILIGNPWMQNALLALNGLVDALQAATRTGTGFVFGYLGGGAAPFAVTQDNATFILAFQALPLVLVVSALSALLYHWRILPLVVSAIAWGLRRTLGVGGAVGCASAANIFVGMIEAPLLIRPYLAQLTRGELFVVMTTGMATIAGTVLVLYATFLNGVIAGPVGHLVTASILSAPAAIVVARVMVPQQAATAASDVPPGRLYQGSMDAIVHGTTDGLRLLLNIVAMLVVMLALVYLANALLGLLPDMWGAPLSLQRMLGWVLTPVAWLMGIPWAEAETAGTLLAQKIVLNELVAYIDLAKIPGSILSERTRLILVYALCGFANFGSLGIMIGGLGAMAPERRAEIVSLGMRSVVAGFVATCITGAVAGSI